MKDRHALWDALSRGFTVHPRSEAKLDALHRYNIIMLCERFGWTIEYVRNLPLDWYQDTVAIISKQQ